RDRAGRGRSLDEPPGHDRADHRAHPPLRPLLPARDRRGHQTGRDPRVRTGHPGLPTGLAGRHGGLRDRSTRAPRRHDAAARRAGSNVILAEWFCAGEGDAAAEYLAAHGGRVEIRATEQAYAASGFELPNDELATFGGGSGYLTATRD